MKALRERCEYVVPEPSYTLDTICIFANDLGRSRSCTGLVGLTRCRVLSGGIALKKFWISALCIMHRARMPRPDLRRLVPALGADRVAQLGKNILPTPLVDISSTAIRARLAAGQPVQGLVPEPVLKYIRQKGLYGLKQ